MSPRSLLAALILPGVLSGMRMWWWWHYARRKDAKHADARQMALRVLKARAKAKRIGISNTTSGR